MYVTDEDQLGCLIGELLPPHSTDPRFHNWCTENSLEPHLISTFLRFPTAKTGQDAIATTYFDSTDTSQVYDLKWRTHQIWPASASIETYYNDHKSLWQEIDFRRLNQIKCDSDIKEHNSNLEEDTVYIFLDGLDDCPDKARSDIFHMVLQMASFPTIEQAYAFVRCKDF